MKRHKQTIKRLELDFWQKMVWDEDHMGQASLDDIAIGLRKVEPVFHKPGWYYRRRFYKTDDASIDQKPFSWFENGVEAYTCDNLVSSFEYEFRIQHHVPLTVEARKSIACLMREHIADKKLIELFSTDSEWWHLRAIYRGIEFWFDQRTQKVHIHSRSGYRRMMKDDLCA